MKITQKMQANTVGKTQVSTSRTSGSSEEKPLFTDNHSPEQHSPMQQDSPEEKLFREFIASRLPRHKASQNLLQKIRNIYK